ncbi:MAG TPA: hypothetical protein VII68_12340, partial [Casimicrobiaceae bacterium]
MNIVPDPAPAIPPFEPPPLPASLTESGRRILWIIGLYRSVCGAALFGIALLVDLKGVGAITPNAFITGTALYFIFGLAAFAWVQMERLPLALPHLALALLAGDIFFLSLV